MQHHEGDGDAQLNSPAGAVKNAGIAVPALFTEKNPGHLVFPGNMAEYLSGADVGTGAAADALVSVYDWRHVRFPLSCRSMSVLKMLSESSGAGLRRAAGGVNLRAGAQVPDGRYFQRQNALDGAPSRSAGLSSV